MKWIALLLFGSVGLAALLFGVGWGWQHYQFQHHGVRAEGRVVALVDTDSSTYPQVEFTTNRGEAQRFRGGIGSSPPDYAVGDKVEVIYDPAQPREAIIASFGELWLAPLALGGFGLVFLLAGIGSFFLVRSSDRTFGPAFQKRMAAVRNMRLMSDEEGIHLDGRVRRIEAFGTEGDFVVVCSARLPGGKEREFQSEPICYRPDRDIIGEAVDIFLDPFDKEAYAIKIQPLLVASAQRRPPP